MPKEAAAAAKVSPADVEPGPHRPTHTHRGNLARRRAHHGPAPVTRLQEAGPWRPRPTPPPIGRRAVTTTSREAGRVCECAYVCPCVRFALSFVPPSLADAAGLAEHSRILRKGPRRCPWRFPYEEDAASPLHKDAADWSFSSAQKSTCRKPRPRDFIGR